MHRFFNNQAVQIFHMPNATTDGDSAVWFRRAGCDRYRRRL